MLVVHSALVTFDSKRALDQLDLEVTEGEIVAILGSSGCGKSTLLRTIAGLQPLESGSITWEGEDLAEVLVHQRDFGLMFQEHALFLHRDVASNVGFGLRMRRMKSNEIEHKVRKLLELVGLSGYERRTIPSLSGGEAQRVALARALAPEPRLLMLDEPLGSLDRCLRDELVHEIRSLHRKLGLTMLHVTHDHSEAFAVADRIAIMQKGRIIQVGAPANIWQNPSYESVARFLGHVNIVTVDEGGVVPWGHLEVAPGRVVIRSDAFCRVDTGGRGAGSRDVSMVSGTVTDVRFNGDRFELHLLTEPGNTKLVIQDPVAANPGEEYCFVIDHAAVVPVKTSI